MPDEEMGCGCGCNDCECKEIDVSKGKTETMIELREQLQIFKDYICTISMTPCSQLGKIMAKVIFWMWCFFRNLLNYVETLDNQEQDMSGYVTIQQYNQLKNAFDKVIANLQDSGAWEGDSLTGNFKPNRNIATGNINLFGGTPDGDSFIRTNDGQTENDLTGGI